MAAAERTTEGATEGYRGIAREGNTGVCQICGTGPAQDVCKALLRALGKQQQFVQGLLLLVTASESNSSSSLSKVSVWGGWCVPFEQGGSLQVPLQAASPSPSAQPLDQHFLPVRWSLVPQQNFCLHDSRTHSCLGVDITQTCLSGKQ